MLRHANSFLDLSSTNAQPGLPTDVQLALPQLFSNRHVEMQSRSTPALSLLLIFAVFLIGIAAAEGRASTFNQNQRLKGGTSSTIVQWDYDIDPIPAAPSVIPLGTVAHIVYGIGVPVGNPNAVSVAITLPSGFTQTGMRCLKFNGPTGPPIAGGTLSAANCTPTTVTIGPLSQPNDKVIVIFDGFFSQAGAFSASFVPSGGGLGNGSEPQTLNMNADILNLPTDIGLTKEVKPKTSGTFGSAATVTIVPPSGVLTYKLKLTNNATVDPIYHSTDVYLGRLLRLEDMLSTPPPTTQDVLLNLTLQNFQCTKSAAPVACPSLPTTYSLAIGPWSSWNLPTISYPNTSNGFLPAGSWFEITFDVVVSTTSVCSPKQNNKLYNAASFSYSNGITTVSDSNPANNTSVVTTADLNVSALPTVCPPPPGIQVTKSVLIPGSWTSPFTYKITITNPNSVTLSGLTLSDLVSSSTATPAFTATPSNVVCTPACSSAPVLNTPLVNPGDQMNLFNANFQPLAPNAVQTVQFDVQYAAQCGAISAVGSITNKASVGGPVSGTASVVDSMPALPVCTFLVTKTKTSGPNSFASFPATFGYQVVFKNTSPTQTRIVRTIVDSISLDSANYGNVPVDYSYSCTANGVTGITGPLSYTSPPSPQPIMQSNNPVWAGIRLIDLSSSGGALFSPGGTLTCNVNVTLKQPPTNDSKCQGAGNPGFVNSAFMDTIYPYNTNQGQPVFYSKVILPLPNCVSIVVGKTPSANVIAGQPMTFTLTVKNAGNDPTPNGIKLIDTVPAPFNVTGWNCTPAAACTPSSGGPGNSIAVNLNPIAGGATTTVTVTAVAPSAPGAHCNTVDATFNPFPPLTYFEGDQNALTTASACVQVQSPPARPTLTKRFDPVQIGPSGTSTLTFNITNSAGDPKQTGISFSDTLPAGLQIVSVLTNGCSGTPTISSDGRTITLTGGQLVGPNADGSGKHSCQIAVKVQATGVCGVYKNNKENFSNVTNLDVSGVNEQLEVIGCTESCPVKANEISCKADGTGGYLYTFTVTNNTGLVVTDVLLTPAPASGITLNPKQPQLPPGGMAIGASLTFQVTITGGQPHEQACFYVTLMTTDGECCTTRVCPVLPDCCGIVKDESIECNSDGTYTYSLSVVNTGANTIEHVYLYPPAGVTMTPNYFPVSLKPGDTFTTKVTIKGAKPGDKLCFGISLHSADMESCCKGEHCIVLPACPLPARP
ncbi:MAG TPA: hypothetical protein VEW46_25400 [Pyrinomonadaceae bacterium]|nr:hypothetical protein [Pyrinomonadaceae bacterium]